MYYNLIKNHIIIIYHLDLDLERDRDRDRDRDRHFLLDFEVGDGDEDLDLLLDLRHPLEDLALRVLDLGNLVALFLHFFFRGILNIILYVP